MSTFALRTVQYWAAIAALVCVGTAVAQEKRAEPKQGNADKSKLVVGDAYVVKVTQGNVERQEQGTLLKVTDEWLVLGIRRLTAEKVGIPWLGEMPYVGEFFRTVKQRDQWCAIWIPRAATTVESRTTYDNREDLAAFKVDELKLEGCTQLAAAVDGKEVFFYSTNAIAIRDGALVFTASKRTKDGFERVPQQVAVGNVLMAAQMMPAEQPAVKTANSHRGTMR